MGKQRGPYRKDPIKRLARQIGAPSDDFQAVATKLLSIPRDKAVTLVMAEISRQFRITNKGSGLKG